jgi:hypothetical protein
MLSLNSKHVEHVKIYLACNFKVNLITHLEVIALFFHQILIGSHVGFPISAKNKRLVYDHPMNIFAKFGSNLFYGFRKKDENVKFP